MWEVLNYTLIPRESGIGHYSDVMILTVRKEVKRISFRRAAEEFFEPRSPMHELLEKALPLQVKIRGWQGKPILCVHPDLRMKTLQRRLKIIRTMVENNHSIV